MYTLSICTQYETSKKGLSDVESFQFRCRSCFSYDSVQAGHALVAVTLISQKIILTINQATQINTRPTAACFKIVNHLSYLQSSHHAVTIRNPPYRSTINAIKAKIQSTRLITHFTTDTNESCLPVHHQITCTSAVSLFVEGSLYILLGWRTASAVWIGAITAPNHNRVTQIQIIRERILII